MVAEPPSENCREFRRVYNDGVILDTEQALFPLFFPRRQGAAVEQRPARVYPASVIPAMLLSLSRLYQVLLLSVTKWRVETVHCVGARLPTQPSLEYYPA